MRAGQRQQLGGVGHAADEVDHRGGRDERRSSPAAARPPPGRGSRTGSRRRPRSSSGPSCARAARARWRGPRRRRRTAPARARRRSRARPPRRRAASSAAAGTSAAGARGDPQDAAAVHVLDHGPDGGLPVTAADGEHGQLALEGHVRLEDQAGAAERDAGVLGLGRRADDALPLAVVALAPRLEHRRQAAGVERRAQLLRAVDGREGRDGDAEPLEQALLLQPVLRHREGRRGRVHRHPAGQALGRGGRHVLELERDDVAGRRRARRARPGRRTPARTTAAAAAAGACSAGSSAVARTSSGTPARASMRASWPPPRMPSLTGRVRADRGRPARPPCARAARRRGARRAPGGPGPRWPRRAARR